MFFTFGLNKQWHFPGECVVHDKQLTCNSELNQSLGVVLVLWLKQLFLITSYHTTFLLHLQYVPTAVLSWDAKICCTSIVYSSSLGGISQLRSEDAVHWAVKKFTFACVRSRHSASSEVNLDVRLTGRTNACSSEVFMTVEGIGSVLGCG